MEVESSSYLQTEEGFPLVSARIFTAIQNLDLDELAQCSLKEIRPLLPCLTRMTLLSQMEETTGWLAMRKQILRILIPIEEVNDIVALLQVNFHELEAEVRKEQQMRQKVGFTQQDTAQFHGLPNGVVLGFERADVARKMRIVLSELFYTQGQIMEQNQQLAQQKAGSAAGLESTIKQSELFEEEIFLQEVADIICIIVAELPSVISVQEVVEVLLYMPSGMQIICWVVANMPDCFKDVVTSLITNGDEDTMDGKLRLAALIGLCEMNPSQALSMRTLCVELLKMPSLAVKLSLRDPQDMVAFISGLLLGNDPAVRSWFALFVRSSQKRKGDVLQQLREELLKQLHSFETFSPDSTSEQVVQATALLRLYCSLRAIAGIKFNDEEIVLIMQLITSKPPPSPSGVRFVSLSLCMLIACPSLISLPSLEAKAIEWIQMWTRDDTYFEPATGEATASFGEMLLLMAIHFHSNQLSNICELVCSTLGIKIPLRPNNTNRMKQIFTQDIFTEQVVAAHAIRVPVTPQLNANIAGYLPVHCIHQLLKSRAFSKHRVTIKSWIYKQICSATTPLHPVLPALVEAYVNSILLPNVKGPVEHSHKPLSEQEIHCVFQDETFGAYIQVRKAVQFDFEEDSSEEEIQVTPSLTAQLLVLYYLLLYEDTRLTNMTTIAVGGREVKSYSNEFLSELPIKYLLQQAQTRQQDYSGLFSSLLRLLITHFPHLSLVDDWIDQERIVDSLPAVSPETVIKPSHVEKALDEAVTKPWLASRLLKLMLKKQPTTLWPLAAAFIQRFKVILDADTPRHIRMLYEQVWLRLNTVLPRRLWIMTIQALMPEDHVTKNLLLRTENILNDPLQILRCDERVFRIGEALNIVLRILQATLAMSKCQLARHILDKPLTLTADKTAEKQPEMDPREELRMALVASQESAAVQILLEACLMTDKDRAQDGARWAMLEARGIICSYIHQVFIAEPSLAKLVHFQGYSRDLLEVTVSGIPSMHICLDFIPELLSMPEMEKQIFAIDLASHLSHQYAMPKSLSVAKLCINTLMTLLGVLSNDMRIEMFLPVLPCIVRFAKAFPPLIEECTLFLTQLGKIAEAQKALGGAQAAAPTAPIGKSQTAFINPKDAETLSNEVMATFKRLVDDVVFQPKFFK